MFAPSSTLHPITRNADPSAYHALGKSSRPGSREKIMSRSELKRFAACPSRWIKGMKEKETDSLEWGSLVDVCALTPDLFESIYSICPETYPAKGAKKDDPIENKAWNWNATFCKDWRKIEEEQGKAVVKSDEASEAWKAAKGMLTDPAIRDFIESCDKQVQICVDWHDETGIVVPVKCLLDLVPKKGTTYASMLGDVKTAASAHPRAWQKAVFDQGYHVQAAFYLDAWNACTLENRNGFAHIVQENFAPYETGRRLLSEEYIALGRSVYQAQISEYCQCLANNDWPGYDDRDVPFGSMFYGPWRIVDVEAWMILQQ